METYLVRVWAPASEEAVAGLHGTVIRLGSGEEISFSDPETLLGFMERRRHGTAVRPPAVTEPQEQASGGPAHQGGEDG